MSKIVLGMSGGMDSSTLLAYLVQLPNTEEIHCCSFYYGSKHNQYELQAAREFIAHYRRAGFTIIHHHIDLSLAFSGYQSNLLKTGGEIPEGHYEDISMQQTVVPARNLIFASVMAGLANSIGADAIALGVHSGDHAIYADCRPEFIRSLKETIYHATDGTVEVKAPFLHKNKYEILKIGYSLPHPVPYELTRTCYKDSSISCGKCGSCMERLEAFEKIGIIDPIGYGR